MSAADFTVPMTELQAVNEILMSIREAPITSISDAAEQSGDATLALDRLRNTTRDVLARGWTFNTDLEYPLIPQPSTGEIFLPAGTVSADFCDQTYTHRGRFVIRGNRVYDRRDNTFNIGQTLRADIAVLLPFDDLPSPFRDLIAKISIRAFQQFILGEAGDIRFTTEDINASWNGVYAMETASGDYNMFDGTLDPTLHRAAFRVPSGRRT